MLLFRLRKMHRRLTNTYFWLGNLISGTPWITLRNMSQMSKFFFNFENLLKLASKSIAKRNFFKFCAVSHDTTWLTWNICTGIFYLQTKLKQLLLAYLYFKVGLKLLKNVFLKELCQLQHLFRRWMTTARAWMPLFLVLSATTTI